MNNLVVSSPLMAKLSELIQENQLTRYDLPIFMELVEKLYTPEDYGVGWEQSKYVVLSCVDLLEQRDSAVVARALVYLEVAARRFDDAVPLLASTTIADPLSHHVRYKCSA